MKRYAFVIVGIVIAVVLIAFYAVHFYNASLSDKTSDGGMGKLCRNRSQHIVGISYLYNLYKEQQESNRIGRFEEHFYISLRTMIELFEKGIP